MVLESTYNFSSVFFFFVLITAIRRLLEGPQTTSVPENLYTQANVIWKQQTLPPRRFPRHENLFHARISFLFSHRIQLDRQRGNTRLFFFYLHRYEYFYRVYIFFFRRAFNAVQQFTAPAAPDRDDKVFSPVPPASRA